MYAILTGTVCYDEFTTLRNELHPAMKRTTIFADDTMLKELKRVSDLEKKSLAQVMREAFEAHLARKLAPQSRFSFAGKFDSRRKDIAEKHEELLWTERK